MGSRKLNKPSTNYSNIGRLNWGKYKKYRWEPKKKSTSANISNNASRRMESAGFRNDNRASEQNYNSMVCTTEWSSETSNARVDHSSGTGYRERSHDEGYQYWNQGVPANSQFQHLNSTVSEYQSTTVPYSPMEQFYQRHSAEERLSRQRDFDHFSPIHSSQQFSTENEFNNHLSLKDDQKVQVIQKGISEYEVEYPHHRKNDEDKPNWRRELDRKYDLKYGNMSN